MHETSEGPRIEIAANFDQQMVVLNTYPSEHEMPQRAQRLLRCQVELDYSKQLN